MSPSRLRSVVLLSVALLCAPGFVGCDSNSGGQPGSASSSKSRPLQIAFVTNNTSEFWKIAEAGVDQAMEDISGVYCEVKMPPQGTAAEQQDIVQDFIARGFDGLSISIIDPKSQGGLIDEAVTQGLKVITQDSDAPDSNRIAFVGTNNYKAGVQAGEALKEALPDGGKVWLFVGKADAQNAIDRRRGLEDAIEGTAIEIVDLRTDDVNEQRAMANAEDVIAANSDVAGLVGLWAYNGPAILEAVKAAGKTGEIQIVAFDEYVGTLQGIKDGHIHATVVQQPYKFGYESVRVLKELLEGNDSVIPADGIIEVPTRVIQQDNVDEFWANLNKLMGKE